MANENVRGRFVWHEVLTTDPKAAAAFYSKVVGWKAEKWPENPSYTLLVTKGVPMAGLMEMPDEVKAMGVPPNWITYIGTPDVDETADQIGELGGEVLKEPTEVPGVGHFVIAKDPHGAVFAAFTPNQGPKDDMTPTLGDFSWHELVSGDWPSAFDFYRGLFGWEKTDAMEMGPELGTYQMYGMRGVTLGGMFTKPASMPAPPHWMPYAMIPDSKKAAGIIAKLGGTILNGPMEVPGGDWIVQAMDPQGAAFAVHSKKPEAAAQSKPKAAASPKKAARPKPKKRAAAKRPAKKAVKRSKAKPKKRAVAKRGGKKRAAPKRAGKKRAASKRAGKKRPARKRAARRTSRASSKRKKK